MKVKISNQKVLVDGQSVSIKRLAEMSGIAPKSVLYVVNGPNCEQKIRELILKADAGVKHRSKTYWYDDRPMWSQKVMEATGLTRGVVNKRMLKWEQDGDDKALFITSEELLKANTETSKKGGHPPGFTAKKPKPKPRKKEVLHTRVGDIVLHNDKTYKVSQIIITGRKKSKNRAATKDDIAGHRVHDGQTLYRSTKTIGTNWRV